MIAGMISEVEVIAIIAAISFTAQCSSATGQNGLDGALVRRKDLLAKTPSVRWPVCGQDFGQFDHRRSSGLRGDRLVKSLERGASFGLAHRRQMGVDDRGIEGLVTEVSADLPQTDAFFE